MEARGTGRQRISAVHIILGEIESTFPVRRAAMVTAEVAARRMAARDIRCNIIDESVTGEQRVRSETATTQAVAARRIGRDGPGGHMDPVVAVAHDRILVNSTVVPAADAVVAVARDDIAACKALVAQRETIAAVLQQMQIFSVARVADLHAIIAHTLDCAVSYGDV